MHSRNTTGWMRSWLCLGLLFGVCACHRGSAPLPAFPPPEVTVARPIRIPVVDVRYHTGRLEAVEKVDVRARVKGFLEKVHFTEGAEIRAGDRLYTIDARTFEADLDRTEAEITRLEAQLKLAVSEADRMAKLRGTRATSEEEFLQKIITRDATRAALAQARAASEMARLELSFTQINAPISGRIGRTLVTSGNLVGFNEPTLLATIVRLDPLFLYFEMSERDYLDFRKLRRDEGGPDFTDRQRSIRFGLDTEDGCPHRGILDFQDNQIDPRTSTILVRAVVPNPDRLLAPGLFARVEVPFSQPRPRWVIPEEAVATDQRGKYVLVLQDDGTTVAYRSIQVGASQGNFICVEKGLGADDWVIVNGIVKARPGSQVTAQRTTLKPPSEKPPPEKPPASMDAR